MPGDDDAFERMTPAAASALLKELWGLEPSELTRLDTERDDSFRVTTADVVSVLKVAHPSDNVDTISLQVEAMDHAFEAGQPVQRGIPTLSGAPLTIVDGRIVRMTTWLGGTRMIDAWPDIDQMREAGAALARLSVSLADFEHPGAHRTFPWDLQRLHDLRELLEFSPSTAVERTIEHFEREILPRLGEVPHQVIHNDFHPGNVLVDPELPAYVVGILDFGDVLYSARIVDVAVSMAYLVTATAPAWPAVQPFLDGYLSVIRLTDLELEFLP
ncbi:MAG: phosphotransferase, partial [Rhodoglobus sp.]